MSLSNTKVLIVEDDTVMGTFVLNTLRRLQIEQIELCTDGESAMKTLGNFVPDVILTDVHMRPVGGIEFVQKLRAMANPVLRSTPVLFMSADSSRETLGDTMGLGSVAYIVKPPNIGTLRTKIEQALQSRQ